MSHKNIGYIISSCKDYSKTTLPKLLSSLTYSRINMNNIIVFMGGYKSYQFDHYMNVRHFECPYDSYDLNALIGVVENRIKDFSHVFLLNDTCSVGHDFKRMSENFDVNTLYTSVSENETMGMFNVKYLTGIEDFLLSKKNITGEENKSLKSYFYNNTGTVKYSGEDRSSVINEESDIYGNGELRSTTYFPNLDLYKYSRISS